MSLRQILFLAAFLPAGVYCQTSKTPAQPVREIDRDAKSGLIGRCDIRITPGTASSKSACSITSISGESIGAATSGKILVIEDVSVQCAKGQLDTIHSVSLSLGAFAPVRYVPLISQGTANGSTRLLGFTSGRIYSQHFDIFANVLLVLAAQGFVNGDVVFTGHLVDAN